MNFKTIEPGNSKLINLEVPEFKKDELKYSCNKIDSVFYIQLETNSSSLIGDIDKILIDDNILIIVEKNKRSSISLFSFEGKFLGKVGQKGRGVGEFVRIDDVAIDKIKKEIIILDNASSDLKFYNYEGKFLRNCNVPFFAKGFSVLDKDKYIFFQAPGYNKHITKELAKYNLIITDDKIEVRYLSIPYDYIDWYSNPDNFFSNNCIHNTQNGAFYTPFLSDTIFRINKDTIFAQYHIKFKNKRSLLKGMSKNTKMVDIIEMLNSNKYFYFNGKALEASDYLYFRIGGENIYYSQNENEIFFGLQSEVDKNQQLVHEKPFSTYENFFVGIVEPFQLIYMGNSRVPYDKKIHNLINNTSLNDNPILMFFSLEK